MMDTGPSSAVGSKSECRYTSHKLDHDPVPYICSFVEVDHEIISTVILLLLLIQEGMMSVTSESTCMCMNFWLTAFVKLTQEKVLFDELTI